MINPKLHYYKVRGDIFFYPDNNAFYLRWIDMKDPARHGSHYNRQLKFIYKYDDDGFCESFGNHIGSHYYTSGGKRCAKIIHAWVFFKCLYGIDFDHSSDREENGRMLSVTKTQGYMEVDKIVFQRFGEFSFKIDDSRWENKVSSLG